MQLETDLTKNSSHFKAMLTESNDSSVAKQAETHKLIEAQTEKFSPVIKALTERLAALEAKLAAKETASPDPKPAQTTEERLGKVEASAETLKKGLDQLRADLQTKLLEVAARPVPLPEPTIVSVLAPVVAKSHDVTVIPAEVRTPTQEKVSELDQQLQQKYVSMDERKEVPAAAGVQESADKGAGVWQKRVDQMEEELKKAAGEVSSLASNQETVFSTLKEMQKTFAEKLKLKVSMEGIDAVVQQQKQTKPNFAKEVPPAIKPQLDGMKLQPVRRADTVADTGTVDKQIIMLANEVVKCASKQSVDNLEQVVSSIQLLLSAKCDRKDVEAARSELDTAMKTLEAKMASLIVLGRNQGQLPSAEEAENTAKLRQDVDTQKREMKKAADLVGKLQFALDDLALKLEQRASSVEVTILKQSMNEYHAQI